MPRVELVRRSDVVRTPRVLQLEGMFDVLPSEKSEVTWTVDLDLPEQWNIGVIVGPSGAGKSTVARELFGEHLVGAWDWPDRKSVLDGFPASMAIKDIVGLLSSVGFSSPPSWVRPFGVLSNGEQFRVNMARTLAEMPSLAVVDEFTSVIDRTVAKIGSAAIAKTVRARKQKFIAVTCHYDVLEWLTPDWVYEPAINEFYTGRYLRRPSIEIEIAKVHPAAWRLFRHHHYLDTSLHNASHCFCAFVDGVPAAFCAVLHFPHPRAKNIKRGHRTVCLPDFQGVGIGNALSQVVGMIVKGCDWKYMSQTAHPAMIRARAKSSIWLMKKKPALTVAAGRKTTLEGKAFGLSLGKRLIASFEYVGPAMEREKALAMWNAAPGKEVIEVCYEARGAQSC